MNKKLISICVLIALLIGACITEQVMAHNFFNNIKENVYYISDYVQDKEDINTPDIYDLVVSLEEKWTGYEHALCFLINNMDIEDIGVELTKMKIYVLENDVVEFKASLAQVLYFADSYEWIMGINFQNVF